MPDVVQLDMDLYIYSFGFRNILSTWKAAIHRYKTGQSHYSHGLQSYHRLKGIFFLVFQAEEMIRVQYFTQKISDESTKKALILASSIQKKMSG